MPRNLASEVTTAVDAPHAEAVIMAQLEFDMPQYLHTRIGIIPYNGNDYIGIGDFGGVVAPEENDVVAPGPFELVISGVDDDHIQEARDAGNFGDRVTVYLGYVNAAGLLLAAPTILGDGEYEYAAIELGDNENKIVITVQHEIADKFQAEGSRWTNEHQQAKFTGDTFFLYQVDGVDKVLNWAGGPVAGQTAGAGRNRGGQDERRR